MKAACIVDRVHRVHINEVRRWAAEEMARIRAIVSSSSPIPPLVEDVVMTANRINDLDTRMLHSLPASIGKDEAHLVARKAQARVRHSGLDLCCRYDPYSHKIVIVGREKAKDICWFSRGRVPAMS